MALSGTITISVEIKSSADKFYNLGKAQAYIFPNITNEIKKVDIQEGGWNVTYTIDGQTLTTKEKVSFDNVYKFLTFVVAAGDLLLEFKCYKVVVKVSPKADRKSIVTWTVDYEKLSGNVGIPVSYLVLYEKLT